MSTFFEDHNLHIINQTLISLETNDKTIVYIILLVALSVYAFILQRRYLDMIECMKDVFSISSVSGVFKFAKPIYFVLLTAFNAILIYLIVETRIIPEQYISQGAVSNPLTLMLYSVAFATAVPISRYILLKVNSIIFEEKTFVKTYTFSEDVTLIYVACFFLPILVVSFVVDSEISRILVYITFIAYLIAAVFGILKAVRVGYKSSKFSIFHIFLYLCTLKIAPIIGFYKLFFIETICN